ncbi:MAG TPA: hypothetical protein VGM31_05445, partial [Puia sp.]
VKHLPGGIDARAPGPAMAASDISSPLMPGVGFPRWNIELSRIRNGHPGSWVVEWQAGRFHFPAAQLAGSVGSDGAAEASGLINKLGQSMADARTMTG